MSAMAFQITSLTTVYPTVYSGADQRKHQNSALLAFVREIHQWLVNSPSSHKGPVMRKLFPLDDIIMHCRWCKRGYRNTSSHYLNKQLHWLICWTLTNKSKWCLVTPYYQSFVRGIHQFWLDFPHPGHYIIMGKKHTIQLIFSQTLTSSLPGQNGCHFADDILRCIFVNENFLILIWISLKFVPKGLIDNNLALVQIMAWRRKGAKPLPEPMLTRFTELNEIDN